MEQRKNKNGGLILLIIILLLTVFGLVGYIVYDKMLVFNDNQEVINDTSIIDENGNAQFVVSEVVKKMFAYIHSVGPYCGERNTNDYIEENDFRWEASNYSSINELNNYLKSFMNDSIIDKYSKNSSYVTDVYKEQNGKLYCLNSNKGGDFSYDEEQASYKIINVSDNSISAIMSAVISSYGEVYNYVFPIELTKDANGNWLISSYIEILTGIENIRIVNTGLLDDVIYYNKINPEHKISIVYGTTTATTENDIEALRNEITAPYETPNGEKWVEIKVIYDKSGYISQIIL